MRATLALVFLILLVFCIMVLVAINCQPRIPGSQVIGLALEWTRYLLGGVVASAAAIGMLLTAASHGSFQRQIVLTMPLVGGLLLFEANWGLALALAAVASIWMFRFGAPDIERPANSSSSMST